jgi:PD-(D/E)XK endonuclease
VKYRTLKNGMIGISFRSNYYDSKRIYSKHVIFDEIDIYAVYCPETEQVYYVPVDEINKSAVKLNLRVAPAKNGQSLGIQWAKDFDNPRQIAPFGKLATASRRQVTEQDEMAIAQTIAHLITQGIQPFIVNSQYLPFDLIAVHPDMKTLKRVRVGWEQVQTTPYADQYALFEPNRKQCVLIDAVDVPAGIEHITLTDVRIARDKIVG